MRISIFPECQAYAFEKENVEFMHVLYGSWLLMTLFLNLFSRSWKMSTSFRIFVEEDIIIYLFSQTWQNRRDTDCFSFLYNQWGAFIFFISLEKQKCNFLQKLAQSMQDVLCESQRCLRAKVTLRLSNMLYFTKLHLSSASVIKGARWETTLSAAWRISERLIWLKICLIWAVITVFPTEQPQKINDFLICYGCYCQRRFFLCM